MTSRPRSSLARFASLATFALILGCASREAAPHGTSYVPLDQGHRLHYRMRVDERTVILIQEIRGTVVRDGHTWSVQLTSTSDGIIHDDPMWLREDDSGTYSRVPNESDESLVLPSHPAVGNEWTIIGTNSRGRTYMTHCVIATVSDLELEGRHYPGCIEVIREDQTPGPNLGQKSAYWYAPGVGFLGWGRMTPGDPWKTWLIRHAA